MAVGEHIRGLRLDARLKQGELAEKAGIAQNTLSRIETGAVAPSFGTLEKISEALGVDVSEMLSERSPQWLLEASDEEFDAWLKSAPRHALQVFFGKTASEYADDHPDDAELLIRTRYRAQAAWEEYAARAGGIAAAIFRRSNTDEGEREPVQDSETGTSKPKVRLGQLHPEEGPRVTAEQLRGLGIEANPSEVAVLNQMLAYRANPTGEIHAYGYVKKEGEPVDFERVQDMLLPAYLLATGALSEEEIRVALSLLDEDVREELVSKVG